jgi:HD domain
MNPNHPISRLEDRMKDCVEKGKIEEAKIINRDSFGAAHRILVRGEAESFLMNKKREGLLRESDLGKPDFIEKVRRNLERLIKIDLKNHVLFRHLEPGQSTPMVEEAFFWDIQTSEGGQVQLPQEVADAIFRGYHFLHNLPPKAHHPYPLFLDGYSVGHATRVSIYSALLVEKIKDPYLMTTRAAKAAFLHDNGKMMPMINALVRKPGKLSDSEYEKVKLHPVIGAASWARLYDETNAETGSEEKGGIVDPVSVLSPILEGKEDFVSVLDAILEHHLRPDGKGYPPYLDGTNNDLIGKIIALTDSFDAMTSKREYDVPRPDPLGYAREEIKRCAQLEWDKTKTDRQKPEHQFDAELAQNFLDLDLAPVLRKAS